MRIRNLVVGIGCVCLGAGAIFAANNKYISIEKAESIAKSKVPGSKVMNIELDRHLGKAVYDIDMELGQYEYDLILDAKTGSGISVTKELKDEYKGTNKPAVNQTTQNTNSQYISMEKAQAIAKNKIPGAKITSTELDRRLGKVVYDIDAELGQYEYDLILDAKTGSGISMTKELKDEYKGSRPTVNQTTPAAPSTNVITSDRAKEIALAQVPGATVVKIELDREDNEYEIELRKGLVEYDVVVHAQTGKVLKVEKED